MSPLSTLLARCTLCFLCLLCLLTPTTPAVPLHDVSIAIADASLNSAAKVLSVAGALDYTGPIPFRNASNLSTLLPCAFAHCPNCTLDASIVFLGAPVITFSHATGASARVSNALVSFTVNSTQIATANANGTTVLNFSRSEDRQGYVKITATVVELYIDIQSTCEGGTVSSALKEEINRLIDALCTDQVIPFINNNFPGIPIPTVAGFTLSNMTTVVMDQYLQVGVDLGAAPLWVAPDTAPTRRETIRESNRATIGGNIRATIRENIRENIRESDRATIGATNRETNTTTPSTTTLPFTTTVTHGDFNINASTAAMKKALGIYLPTILSQLGNVAVPAMSGEAKGVKWSTAATSVEHIHIGQATVDVLPNVGVAVTLSNIGLAIPTTAFEVSKRIIVNLHCSGKFSGALANTQVAVTLKVVRDKSGAPVVTPSSAWSWGSIDIEERLDDRGKATGVCCCCSCCCC